jgi:putative PIN family toxin of toxin-antitoxin system
MVLLTSPAAIDEFLDVARRRVFRKIIAPDDANRLADLLRRAELFVPAQIVPVCRDPDDNYLLALAAAGSADVLVTRDEDLLTLRRYGNTEIIHVAEFLKRLQV